MQQPVVDAWLQAGFARVQERFFAEGMGVPIAELPIWFDDGLLDGDANCYWLQRIVGDGVGGLFQLQMEITLRWDCGVFIVLFRVLGGPRNQVVLATQGLMPFLQIDRTLPDAEIVAAVNTFVTQAPALFSGDQLQGLFEKLDRVLAP